MELADELGDEFGCHEAVLERVEDDALELSALEALPIRAGALAPSRAAREVVLPDRSQIAAALAALRQAGEEMLRPTPLPDFFLIALWTAGRSRISVRRACTDSQSVWSTIRSSGTSWVTHALSGFSRASRFPVDGVPLPQPCRRLNARERWRTESGFVAFFNRPTRQRCHEACSTLAIAAFSPSWASETTSLTPRRPRRASERRNSVQKVSASEQPTDIPSTSRRPSLLAATATIAATETMRPSWRIFT
jgi:hypothetical protein